MDDQPSCNPDSNDPATDNVKKIKLNDEASLNPGKDNNESSPKPHSSDSGSINPMEDVETEQS